MHRAPNSRALLNPRVLDEPEFGVVELVDVGVGVVLEVVVVAVLAAALCSREDVNAEVVSIVTALEANSHCSLEEDWVVAGLCDIMRVEAEALSLAHSSTLVQPS